MTPASSRFVRYGNPTITLRVSISFVRMISHLHHVSRRDRVPTDLSGNGIVAAGSLQRNYISTRVRTP